MPLLSLPAELLKEVVLLVIQTSTPSLDSCGGPGCSGVEVLRYCPCTPPAATSLAHTCRVLRSHTLPLMYASVTVNLAHSRTLLALFTSSPDIASCVRALTLFVTDTPSSQPLHGIRRRLPNLLHLLLDGTRADGHYIASLLVHVRHSPLHSLTLRTFEWLEIWDYLCSTPNTLHTLRLEDPFRPFAIVLYRAAMVRIPYLPHVHTFICHTELFDLPAAREAGGTLPQILPNVRVLDIYLTDITTQFLHRYAELGTRLTELTVHFLTAQPLFCETLAKLAPSLQRFVMHGGRVCETMFQAKWRCIEVLDVACQGGCKGVLADVVRGAVWGLIAARPKAKVSFVVEGGRELVVSDETGANVASLEAFGVLEDMQGDY